MKNKIIIFFPILFLSLIFVSCDKAKKYNEEQSEIEKTTELETKKTQEKNDSLEYIKNIKKDKQELEKELKSSEIELITHEYEKSGVKNQISIYKFKKKSAKTQIIESEDNQSFLKDLSSGFSDSIIINGGYFNEDLSSSGFLVIDKKTVQSKKFDQDKSGLFEIKEGEMNIRNLKKNPIKKNEKFDFALQSYPLLIVDNKNNIKTDSQKLARRTAIGEDQDGNFYIIISDAGDLSLYSLSQELLKTGIHFENALNLDGAGSTGISLNFKKNNTINSYTSIANVIAFSFKK